MSELGVQGEMGEPGLTGLHGYNGRPGLRGPKGEEGDAGLGINVLFLYSFLNGMTKINKMFNFSVIDGILGAKGEAGIPGRFGYDGFPGELNLRVFNFVKSIEMVF